MQRRRWSLQSVMNIPLQVTFKNCHYRHTSNNKCIKFDCHSCVTHGDNIHECISHFRKKQLWERDKEFWKALQCGSRALIRCAVWKFLNQDLNFYNLISQKYVRHQLRQQCKSAMLLADEVVEAPLMVDLCRGHGSSLFSFGLRQLHSPHTPPLRETPPAIWSNREVTKRGRASVCARERADMLASMINIYVLICWPCVMLRPEVCRHGVRTRERERDGDWGTYG